MAAEKVKERLARSTAAPEKAGVPYAVVGGNAVAEWVGRVDEDAVRNTRDVDILIRRTDLEAAKVAPRPPALSTARVSEWTWCPRRPRRPPHLRRSPAVR